MRTQQRVSKAAVRIFSSNSDDIYCRREKLWANYAKLWGVRSVMRTPTIASEVQVLDAQRVFLDEFATGFYDVAHQFRKQIVGFDHIVHSDLQ